MSYAIFRALGKQFRAETGKTLKLPLMVAEPGAKITFDEVLLSSDARCGSTKKNARGFRTLLTEKRGVIPVLPNLETRTDEPCGHVV